MTAACAHVARQVFDNAAALRLVLRVLRRLTLKLPNCRNPSSSSAGSGKRASPQRFADKGFLAPGLKEAEARDIVYALMSIDTYRILRLEQHWSGARYERWLANALYRLLVAPVED